MTEAYLKPVPTIDDSNRPHWEGAREGKLRIQRCTSCGAFRYPPARICAECRNEGSEWVTASGKGRIWSWCVFHRPYFKGFDKEMPYAVVMVELDEGPRLYSNMVGISKDDLRIGMPVRAVFEPATPELTLVKFEEDK